MANIFQGVIHQLSRNLQVFLQKTDKETDANYWRPGVLCLSKESFERLSALEMMKWISYRYGFGTYIHYEKDYFSKNSKEVADKKLQKLIKTANNTKSNVFLETIIFLIGLLYIQFGFYHEEQVFHLHPNSPS